MIMDRVQKLVTFSPQLYHNAEMKSKQLGVTFAEYVRHLIINDVEEDTNLPMVDEETNKRIGQSLKALKEGKFSVIDPSKEEELNKIVGLT